MLCTCVSEEGGDGEGVVHWVVVKDSELKLEETESLTN
jgi:hypothetical protein